MAIIADEEQLAYGLRELIRLDPRFAWIVERSGPLPMRKTPEGFEGLANIVTGQMISRAAADAIWQRMLGGLPTMTAEAYLEVSEELARSFGLSGAKHRTMRYLAQQVETRQIKLHELSSLSGDEAHNRLIALKGIGPWTADVYLLFALGHADVFPAGDVALQAAAVHALHLDQSLSEKELKSMALVWRPWRSIAARTLWAYYSNVVKRNVTPMTKQ